MVGVYGIYFTLATEIDALALRARGRLYIGSRGEINPVDTSIHRLTYNIDYNHMFSNLFRNCSKRAKMTFLKGGQGEG